MKLLSLAVISALVASMMSCTPKNVEETAVADSDLTDKTEITNCVIETIMSRRSVRDYKPVAVGRDTMEVITLCGINAPNGMNRQPWEIRVVDDPEFINGITAEYLKSNPDACSDPKFRNMFRNAPTVVFIAAENNSQLDCGLLGENMVLSAWSMGIGSCCLGGPVRFMKENGADYLARLGFSEGYELVYAIGFGYPAETPDAKPRDASKVKFL